MDEHDETPVSRRQLFEGLAGGLRRVIGEMASPEPHEPEVPEEPGPPKIDPEQQDATLRELFGFLDTQRPPE
jgi:hypothetical protein